MQASAPSPLPDRPRRLPRVLLILAGIALLGFLVFQIGWAALQGNLTAVGPRFVLLVAIYALAQAAFTLGWWVVLPGQPRVSFWKLFAVYLAGDTLNYVAPVGVAGEPVKARLLAENPGTRPAFASLAIHKHAELLAQTVFLLVGVTIALVAFPLSTPVRVFAVVGVVLLGLLLTIMTVGLLRGAFVPIVKRAKSLPFVGARLSRFEGAAEELDATIREFYGAEHRRFFVSAFWCFFGWCGGLVETLIVLSILAPGRGFMTAYAIEALSMAIGNLLLVIPARLGFAEGVRVGVFTLLGLTSAQGLAYGLVRRAREIVWAIPGAIVLLRRQARTKESPIPEPALAAGGERS